jgi:hypothetical protein
MTKRAQKYTPKLSEALALELVMQATSQADGRLANGYMYDVFGGAGGASEHCLNLGLK